MLTWYHDFAIVAGMENNPLLIYKNDKDESFIRFDLIKDEHFEEAFEVALKTAKENLQKIIENPEPQTFENSIEALEYMSEDLDRVNAIFTNLKEAHTSKELERVAEIVLPKLADFSNDVALNKILFSRVKIVYDASPQLETKEQKRLLEKTYKGFIRNGALLSDEDKLILREYDKQLSLLSQTFGENLLGATNEYQLHITNEADIFGLPDRNRDAAKQEAVTKGKDGWVFTLKAPSIGPFMQYIGNDSLRKELSIASGKRCMGGSFDNKKIVFDIVKIRKARALLLGYKSHAHFVLEEAMAKTPERVDTFFETLYEVVRPFAEKDFEMLRSYKEKISGDVTLYPWDVSYYEEKFKKERFDFNEESLRPYFQIDLVIKGVFEHARRLYGLEFIERKDIPTYHEDVVVYEVKEETGEHKGLLYFDLYTRASKGEGGWMNELRSQSKKVRPWILIVCNFARPTVSHPALLNFSETETIFHEVGHAIHSLLSDCQYKSLSGTSVTRDFVELPSQFMDRWVKEKDSISLFARHYETGEVLPEALIEKAMEVRKVLVAFTTLLQIGSSVLDKRWHEEISDQITDIEQFEAQVKKPYRFFEHIQGTSHSTSFGHIFQYGYDVGYYSYHWAEVLATDAFEYFKENGGFSKEIAKKFRDNVLSKGNTEEPLELYRAFRGRDADPKALLRDRGLI